VSGAGSTWVASGSLAIGSTYNQYATGIVTIANGGRVEAHEGTVIGLNGTLTGHGGTLAGAVTSYGQIRPGSSVGTMTVEGALNLKTDSTIYMELSGTSPVQHDHLSVTGHSALAGTLCVTLDGYTPAYGDTFDIFDWGGGAAGVFDTLQLPSLGGTLVWTTTGLYTSGELRVTPEPVAPLLALLGAAACWARRWHG